MLRNTQLIAVLESFVEHLKAKERDDTRRFVKAKMEKDSALQQKITGRQEVTAEILGFVTNLLKMYAK